jgi:hypothetical protein
MSEQQQNIEQNLASAEIARLKAIVEGNGEQVEQVDNGEQVEHNEVDKDKNVETLTPSETTDAKNDVVDEKKVIHSDEDVLAYLKSQNIDIESIDELRSKVNPKEEVESAEKNALKKLEIKKWAIETQKIDPQKLDQFEEDSKLSDIELAYRVYFEERKNETNYITDEPYTDEELREEFESENYLMEDDDYPLKKRKLKNISLIAQTYKYDNYKDLIELEKSYENELINESERKILNETTATAKSKLVKDGISYTIKDDLGKDIVVNIPITNKLLDEIEINPNDIEDISDTIGISDAIKDKYFVKNLGKVLHEVATAYHSKKILGLKANSIGIENRKHEMGSIAPDEIEEKYKKLVEKHTVSN